MSYNEGEVCAECGSIVPEVYSESELCGDCILADAGIDDEPELWENDET